MSSNILHYDNFDDAYSHIVKMNRDYRIRSKLIESLMFFENEKTPVKVIFEQNGCAQFSVGSGEKTVIINDDVMEEEEEKEESTDIAFPLLLLIAGVALFLWNKM